MSAKKQDFSKYRATRRRFLDSGERVRVSYDIDTDLHNEFRELTRRQRVSMRLVVEELIRDYCEEGT